MSNTHNITETSNYNNLLAGLETLASRIVDHEALTNAAAEALARIPYLPAGNPGAPVDDVRLHFGRLQALVMASSESAAEVLREVVNLLRAHRPDAVEALRSPTHAGHGRIGPDGTSEAGEPRALASTPVLALPAPACIPRESRAFATDHQA